MRALAVLVLVLVAGCPSSGTVQLDKPSRDAREPDPSAQPIDWHGRSIYFVMTDRFANGDRANDDADGYRANPGDRNAWHGGDFQGVIDRLDYIAGMGFTGIWLTPIIAQRDNYAYHGYWGWDWSHIDGHLGDAAKLRELVDAAHARGIAVMIDTVANHTGRYNYTTPTFPDPAMYHHNGGISDYNNRDQVENNDLAGLNDLAQENPVVRAKLLEHVRWLVNAGADGLRVDTVKHVPSGFWTEYVAAANVFTMGEVLDGAVERVAPYSHTLAATLDYPLYFAMRDVFAHRGSARALGGVLAKDSQYSDPQLAGVFVDNHDQARFLCDAGNSTDQLRLALVFSFTTRGIPIVYYGTEQGFASCSDNRQDMFAAADPQRPLYATIAQLNRIRSASEALRVGAQLERWQDDTAYAFERIAGTSAAIVAFNVSDAARTLTLHNLRVAAGTALHDALGSGATATVTAAHDLTVAVPARGAVVLEP